MIIQPPPGLLYAWLIFWINKLINAVADLYMFSIFRSTFSCFGMLAAVFLLSILNHSASIIALLTCYHRPLFPNNVSACMECIKMIKTLLDIYQQLCSKHCMVINCAASAGLPDTIQYNTLGIIYLLQHKNLSNFILGSDTCIYSATSASGVNLV